MEHLPRITQEPFCSQLTQKLGQLGFKYITLDLQGRRSGSQNLVLQIEQPSKF
jgi:PP-loop superfamily ATP-utilizing enzyme